MAGAISFEAYIEMLRLQDVMNANRIAVAALADSDDSEAGKMIAAVSLGVLDAAQDRSPFLYGILMSAHRAEMSPGQGRIFIDPSVVHPVLGGRPAVYGPELHASRPWFEWTVRQDAPAILNKEAAEFVKQIEVIYSGN